MRQIGTLTVIHVQDRIDGDFNRRFVFFTGFGCIGFILSLFIVIQNHWNSIRIGA